MEEHFGALNLSVVSTLPNENQSQEKKWKVAHRLVTPHPLNENDGGASIETVWEICGEQQRVAVYSGPDAVSARTLQISLQLPDYAVAPPDEDDPCLQWTVFAAGDSKQSKKKKPVIVLACLVHPNAVTLWDVYGTGDLPSEGWTVTLPFDCRSILALPDEGLLLQRLETPDDNHTFEASGAADHDFVLQGPPPLWNNSNNHTVLPQVPVPAAVSSTASSGGVASLFTLHHPLEDVLPVSLSDMSRQQQSLFSSQPQAVVTDVLEQVLWVGTAKVLLDNNETNNKRQVSLMVTYHTQQHRHAVWQIRDAPPPPAVVPLFQQLQQKYRIGNVDWDDNHDMMGVAERPLRVSRDEALADALGVSTTSRKTSIGPNPSMTSSRKRQKESLYSPTGGGGVTTNVDV